MNNEMIQTIRLSLNLREAVIREDLEAVRTIMPLRPSLKPPDTKLVSTLWIALLKAHSDICIELVRGGANVNERLGLHMFHDPATTPLYHAIANNLNENLIDALIAYGANVDATITRGDTPLSCAIRLDKINVTKKLLRAGASVDSIDCHGMTIVHYACQSALACTLLPILARYNADFTSCDGFGYNALHHLIKQARPDIVEAAKFLIRRRVAIDQGDWKDKVTPLHKAVHYNYIDLVKLLIAHGANVNARTRLGKTPLYLATGNKRSSITEYLLQNGANINDRTLDGRTLLHNACFHKSEENIQFLLSRGVASDVEDVNGQTAFSLIEYKNASVSNKIMIRHFAKQLERGLAINEQDRRIIGDYPKLNDYFTACVDELTRMKTTVLLSNVTMYHLVAKSIATLTKHAANRDFAIAYERTRVDDVFPVFAADLNEVARKIAKNCDILDCANDKLYPIFVRYLPELVIEIIARYTVVDDLYFA